MNRVSLTDLELTLCRESIQHRLNWLRAVSPRLQAVTHKAEIQAVTKLLEKISKYDLTAQRKRERIES